MQWMKAWAVALAMFVAPSLAHAQARGEIQEVVALAPSLAGNLLETPTQQEVSVYVPPSYRSARARRYAVIYLLHGYSDGRVAWTREIGVADILDRLIAAHRIPEVIVVMPEGVNRYGGGFYRNSSVAGRWGDFIAQDLMQFTDAHFRTLTRTGGRAIVGWSMGGYGAIHLAMERPGLYAAAYGISPCCLAPVEDLGLGNDAWKRVRAFTSAADVDAAMQARDFYPVAAMAVLTAFSPDPNNAPLYVRFPYDVRRTEAVPNAGWDAYAAQFPIARVAQSQEALRGLRAFGFDYGINDQFAHVPVAARAFSAQLAQWRIPHRFEVYDGDHRNHVKARFESVVLPYIANALDAPE